MKRFRQIPASGRILVDEGDPVQPDTVVAKIETLPGRLMKVNAAAAVGVEPRDLKTCTLGDPGDRVSAGAAVAARTDFFERRAARSPVDGVVSVVSRNLGYVYIREIIELGETAGPVTVEASKILGISPRELDRFRSPGMRPGAIVAKGQVLASVDRGPRRHAVAESPIYGRIREVSLSKGTVTIWPLFSSLDVTAYIRGRVTAVVPDRGVEVTGRGIVLEGVWGVGGEAHGPLAVVSGDLSPSFSPGPGSIVAVNGTCPYHALLSLAEAGASGVIMAYMSSETALGLVGPRGNLGVTGDEDPPLPVVVTEGFLPASINDRVSSVLMDHEGATVSIRGVTHIRAGVIRPEVIISAE